MGRKCFYLSSDLRVKVLLRVQPSQGQFEGRLVLLKSNDAAGAETVEEEAAVVSNEVIDSTGCFSKV